MAKITKAVLIWKKTLPKIFEFLEFLGWEKIKEKKYHSLNRRFFSWPHGDLQGRN